MLGKADIIKELGREISIYPFNKDNIKGNAINLTASELSWALKSQSFWITTSNNIATSTKPNEPCTEYTINKYQESTITYNNQKYIVLLPLSTTLIETNEVIAVGNRIGGTYHSKVAVVSKGVCHIGTYLEPNYCGHSLLALNSMCDDPILLPVNSVITSITFFYLHHSVDYSLRGAFGGRLEVLTSVGIFPSQETSLFLFAQWKNDYKQIRERMINDEAFKSFIESEKRITKEDVRRYINLRNIIVALAGIVFCILTYAGAKYLDYLSGNSTWVDRFWNVGCSGLIIGVLSYIFKHFKH